MQKQRTGSSSLATIASEVPVKPRISSNTCLYGRVARAAFLLEGRWRLKPRNLEIHYHPDWFLGLESNGDSYPNVMASCLISLMLSKLPKPAGPKQKKT